MAVVLRLFIRCAPDEHLEDAPHVQRIWPRRPTPAVREIDGTIVVDDPAYRRRSFLIGQPHRELRARGSADQNDAAGITAESVCFLGNPVQRGSNIDDLFGPLPLGRVAIIDRDDQIALLPQNAARTIPGSTGAPLCQEPP